MNLKETYKNNKGFALVLSLLIMAAMTAIGLAAVTTATTDMMIAKNEYEAKKAFYLAEAGIVEALVRMDQPQVLDDGSDNPRYIGETPAQRDARVDNYDSDKDTTIVDGSTVSLTYTFWGDGTDFGGGAVGGSDVNTLVGAIGGNYEVVVEYAIEGDDQFVYKDRATPEPNGMVLFCTPYIANSNNLYTTCEKALPVYKITSTGQSAANTSVTIVNYVTSSTLNILPPSGEVYAQGTLDFGSSAAQSVPAYISGGTVPQDTIDDCLSPDCFIVDPHVDTNMCTHIGIDIDSMRSSADSPSPYDQTGGGPTPYDSKKITANDGHLTDWGDYCSDADLASTNKEDHICNNEAKIIFIDNNTLACGATTGTNEIGPAVMNGGEGRGILIITGDAKLGGNFFWEGLIYVLGNLEVYGTINVYGDIMVGGNLDGGGNITLDGDDDIAMGVAMGIATPLPIRWMRARR